jgi:hypothetical protein
LRRGHDPQPSAALSTLRTLRAELIERYGEGEAVPVQTGMAPTALAAASAPVGGPAPPTAAPVRAIADGVAITELCYQGERALRRALELRPQIEALAGSDATARENVEELFDLIRLGIG